MRDIEQTAKYCRKILDSLDVPYDAKIEYRVNTRFRSRWGCCKKRDGKFTIEIHPLLADSRVNEDALITTLIHELIHTCPDCMNHGALWKSYAQKVHRAYGYPIQTTIRLDEIYGFSHLLKEGSDAGVSSGEKYRFVLVCQKCGKMFFRKRASQTLKHPEHYRCSCGGSLKAFQLKEPRAESEVRALQKSRSREQNF